jgi:hypothetical protein
MLYSSHISWSSPSCPTPLELYPGLACDRLFKDEAQRGEKSVLDAVLAEANSFRRNISSTDQRKLDEYFNSVREVEQRIEQAGRQGELQGWRPTLGEPDVPRPADGIPQNLAEHMRLMCDILSPVTPAEVGHLRDQNLHGRAGHLLSFEHDAFFLNPCEHLLVRGCPVVVPVLGRDG